MSATGVRLVQSINYYVLPRGLMPHSTYKIGWFEAQAEQ